MDIETVLAVSFTLGTALKALGVLVVLLLVAGAVLIATGDDDDLGF